MSALISYHGDPAVKAKYVQRFAAHRAADEVIQGTAFEDGRGCFVGCTLNAYEHGQFPVELGWPEWLAMLADTIFEGLPKAEAPQFGTDLLEAVPVGVDLESVKSRFFLTIQRRNLARLEGSKEPYVNRCRTAIQSVIDWLSAGATDDAARSAAARSAESAAKSARSAAESARSAAAWSAESAARSAAWSAWSAAESARSARSARSAESAESASRSAAWSAVRSAAVRSARLARSAESAESASRSAAWSAVRSAAVRSARLAAASAVESAAAAEYQAQRDDLLTIIRACEVAA